MMNRMAAPDSMLLGAGEQLVSLIKIVKKLYLFNHMFVHFMRLGLIIAEIFEYIMLYTSLSYLMMICFIIEMLYVLSLKCCMNFA